MVRRRSKLPYNPSVTASPCHLPLHKGGVGLLQTKTAPQIPFMTIGFSKHEHFYDRVLSRTVIARSEATWQSVSQTLRFFERFCGIDLYEGDGIARRGIAPQRSVRIATPVCGLVRNDIREWKLGAGQERPPWGAPVCRRRASESATERSEALRAKE